MAHPTETTRLLCAFVSIAVIGCGSSAAPARPPAPPVQQPDAAVEATAPDAGVPDAVTTAPAWVFRYSTAERKETWTLQYSGTSALLVVESARGPLRYVGSAADGTALALDVTTGSARLALDCKHAKRAISRKCNDSKAKPIDVLDCYHPDFKAPMPFGPAPGVEYVVDDRCNGYRLIAP
jgi:hypothetical protein